MSIILIIDLASNKPSSAVVQWSVKLMGLQLLAALLDIVHHMVVARKLMAMVLFSNWIEIMFQMALLGQSDEDSNSLYELYTQIPGMNFSL